MAKYPANAQDPYLETASGLLRNRLGIADQNELDRAEATLSTIRAYELDQSPAPARFDLAHLQTVHRTLLERFAI